MGQAVLLGDPAFFEIKAGANPHTRDRWGRRKRVDRQKAIAQWKDLKATLEGLHVKVHVLPAVEGIPGLVFPANAGFHLNGRLILSNLNPSRAPEIEQDREFLKRLGFFVSDFPAALPFEGEADFFPVGDPSGDPSKEIYLFTYGRIEKPRWVFRVGLPPYRRLYGFRSDREALSSLKRLVPTKEILPLQLVDERYYHGDTALCSFGPHREHLLAFLPALSEASGRLLKERFGERLIPLGCEDGGAFAANSFQVATEYEGETRFVLLTPDGLTDGFYRAVRSKGVIPCPVDVSEFLEKGGGAVKCLLLDLGDF